MTAKGNGFEEKLKSYIQEEKAATDLIRCISSAWLDKSVELIIFRHQLIDRSVSEILNLHQYAREIIKQPIHITDTLGLTQELLKLDLAPAKIDIGKLAGEYLEVKDKTAITDFVADKFANFIGRDKTTFKPKDVILYGFGRIGRLLARELITQAGRGEQLRLRAIVTRSNSDADIIKRASLFRVDSVHGPFPGTIIEDLENKSLIVNGHTIQMLAADSPADIDYEAAGISNALLIDNTGAWRDREGLSQHLKAKGVDKVLLTAPGKGDIPNIVHGVNQQESDLQNERIFSAASCTTNAIVPVLKVMQDNLGITSGHIETIHSYTNDQNLLDNYHKKYRRGRSAPMNLVITETGAAKAVAKVLPQLKGILTANAVRVPTPDVSLAILSLKVNKKVTVEEVNDIMKDAALKGQLVEQIQYSFSHELVSSDLIGNPCAVVYDSPATIIGESGQDIVLYAWYDNEYGYTRQVIRLSKYLSQVRRLTFY
ncbi:MAG: glyceraldehyde-3-phosphate dehydrogenase [Flavobacteriales bacterium]|nr:glyceraldehyde-3-phosphate dehydrogenase [Flavobacteriales bacterium]MCB9447854.1 glyceraldehyde-3-phosphate dehydrogenase [Flavobacteriales bacterium]